MGRRTNGYILLVIRITDPDRDAAKTCLGGGMHCPSASSSTSHRSIISDCLNICIRQGIYGW